MEACLEPKTSAGGAGNYYWTKWLMPFEEPDPEDLGKRVNELTQEEALNLANYLKYKYDI